MSPDAQSAEALRRALRKAPYHLPYVMDKDDVRQEAEIAIWKASSRVDPARADHEALAMLVANGVGAVQDAIRMARPGGYRRTKEADPVAFDIDDAPEIPQDSTQESLAQTLRHCDTIARLPHPLPAIALMKMAGVSNEMIGIYFGYTRGSGRIGQLLRQLADELAED